MHTFFMQFENNITTNKTSWKVQNISAVFNTNDSAFTDAKNKSKSYIFVVSTVHMCLKSQCCQRL